MIRENGSVVSHIVRIAIIAVLSMLTMMSLSGCLGFDIHISTPFDKLEQRVEEIERDGDDDRLRDEEEEDIEYGDGDIFADEDGFIYDKDGNIIRNPPQTNRDLGYGINELVNHL